MNIFVHRHAFSLTATLVLGFCLAPGFLFAQDVPPPKPKPNVTPTNSKPKRSSTSTQQSTYGLVVKVDMDCNVSVDGGDPVLVRAGKAHKFASGVGQHLVQAETLNGNAKDEQSVDQKEAQLVVQMNLSSAVAKIADAQRQEQEAQEARRRAVATLSEVAGNWNCFFQEDEYGAEGMWTSEKTGRTHLGNEAARHLNVTWAMQLRQQGEQLAGSLSRQFQYALIQTPTGKTYDSFTWNGQQFTAVGYVIYYTLQGAPQANGDIMLDAMYQRCEGAGCGTVDNDPRAQDMNGGTVVVKGVGELDWTQKGFNPQTKVFKKQ